MLYSGKMLKTAFYQSERNYDCTVSSWNYFSGPGWPSEYIWFEKVAKLLLRSFVCRSSIFLWDAIAESSIKRWKTGTLLILVFKFSPSSHLIFREKDEAKTTFVYFPSLLPDLCDMLAADGENGVHSIRGKVDAWPSELHLTRKYVAFLKNMF